MQNTTAANHEVQVRRLFAAIRAAESRYARYASKPVDLNVLDRLARRVASLDAKLDALYAE